jgi:hypothetical protein
MGKYEGRFSISVQAPGRQPVLTDLSSGRFFDGELWFSAVPWSIAFADYNHDGRLDFNIGQYGGCAGFTYRFFTITAAGVVEALPVADAPRGVWSTDRANSSSMFHTTPAGFRTSQPGSSASEFFCAEYSWNPSRMAFTRITETPGFCAEDDPLAEASVHLDTSQQLQIELRLSPASPVEGYPGDALGGPLLARVKVGRQAWVTTNLSELLGERSMVFMDTFTIALADYNHDGQWDFNVGQPCGSNNFCYFLFTIEASGRVSALQLPHGFVWVGDYEYSTRQITLTSDGFSYSGYDPLCGGFEKRCRWDPTKNVFVDAGTDYSEPKRCAP